MATFMELNLPRYDKMTKKWYVETKLPGGSYLLKDGSGLAPIMTITHYVDLYFDFEFEAYEAMARYYQNVHGQRFPYFNEWGDALAEAAANVFGNLGTVNGTVESQVMEF